MFQLMPVMVQPQRGHSEPVPDRQVVPQLEQVLADGVGVEFVVAPQPWPCAALPQA